MCDNRTNLRKPPKILGISEPQVRKLFFMCIESKLYKNGDNHEKR